MAKADHQTTSKICPFCLVHSFQTDTKTCRMQFSKIMYTKQRAWRDRDLNDIFAHCALTFSVRDFYFSNFQSELLLGTHCYFFLSQHQRSVFKTRRSAGLPRPFSSMQQYFCCILENGWGNPAERRVLKKLTAGVFQLSLLCLTLWTSSIHKFLPEKDPEKCPENHRKCPSS